MNEGLFTKHIQQILSHTDAKQKIINSLIEKTGISVEKSEITLTKKIITLSTSSVKKAALLQKGSKEILEALGYTLHI